METGGREQNGAAGAYSGGQEFAAGRAGIIF
jgi:hypothetical protein